MYILHSNAHQVIRTVEINLVVLHSSCISVIYFIVLLFVQIISRIENNKRRCQRSYDLKVSYKML